ncbi:MAG: hypothetical protein ACOC5R_04910 [Elusimicrobiota bacterium]
MKQYMVDEKKIDLAEYKWDILVILDACRYDMFKKVYKDIIGRYGTLKKAISPTTTTQEFLKNIFHDKSLKDVIYISGNPYINSTDISLSGFDPKKHFKKVVDVWDFGWDDKLGTVHPKELNKSAIVSLDLHRKNRHIIHYLQPHSPYIYYSGEGGRIDSRTETKNKGKKEKKYAKGMEKIAKRIFSDETIWKMGDIVGKLPDGGIGSLWKKYGKGGIIKGYTEDLKLVLNYVKVIIDKYPEKKIVITADHGERLGEKGYYGHSTTKRDKEVIEVPWFETKVE